VTNAQASVQNLHSHETACTESGELRPVHRIARPLLSAPPGQINADLGDFFIDGVGARFGTLHASVNET
jgi:hypothetical protein